MPGTDAPTRSDGLRRKRFRRRMAYLATIVAVLAVAATAVILAAVNRSPARPISTPACAAGAGDSTLLDTISVPGELGAAPRISLDRPLTTSTTFRHVVIPGNGVVAKAGMKATLNYAVYNARTGALLHETGYGKNPDLVVTLKPGYVLPALYTGALCGQKDSRTVVLAAASDAFGTAGNTAWGVKPNEPLIFVVDMIGLR